MRMCRAVLVLASVLGVAACATTSGGDESRTIVVEVTHAPVDRGPLTIFIHPRYQGRRIRLGDVLPGGDARYSYEVGSGGPHVMTAEPQVGGSSVTVSFDLSDDAERLVWDMRTNIVQVR